MPAAIEPLYIEAGATFTRQFEYLNDDGTPFDLTGYSALLQIREAPEAALALEQVPAIDLATGTFSIEFSAEQTATLTLPAYVYAMELYAPDGVVTRLVQGKVTVSPEVVRA
jgi:hypothetical protein